MQDLRSQFSDSQTTVQRLESENKRITRQLNKSREAADQHKNEAERLKNGMEELKANHETAIAQARKQAASLQRDKSDLQQSLDTLKAEMARLNRRLPRMGSPLTPEGRERSDLLTPNDREMDDVFSTAPSTSRRRGDTSAMFSTDGDFGSSPDVSPSRPFQAPNHPSNEVEALQQRLAHAQRQINTLKSTLQREKELKIEYRKRLDVSPAVSSELNTEEYVSDEDTEDGTAGTGKKPWRMASFRPGRGGRGRGGARGVGGARCRAGGRGGRVSRARRGCRCARRGRRDGWHELVGPDIADGDAIAVAVHGAGYAALIGSGAGTGASRIDRGAARFERDGLRRPTVAR